MLANEAIQPLPQEMLEPSTNVIEYPEDTTSTVLEASEIRKDLGLSANVSSPKKCPTIQRPSPRLQEKLVAAMGDSSSMTISESNMSYHFYIHVQKGPEIEEIAQESGLSRRKIERLHVMFAGHERVYFMWIGAGGGPPIVGGGLNNTLACNKWTGVWPMRWRNYCGFLMHPEVLKATVCVLDETMPLPMRKKKLEQVQRTVHENEGWPSYSSSWLAFAPDLWGQRLGSEWNGWWQDKKGQIKGK